MPEPASTCPSTVELERLAEGAPPTPEQSSHIQACEPCRERVDASRRDATFLTRVRHLVAPALAPDGAPRIAGYRVQEIISRGAQGVVYRGVQESTNRPVAIKLLQSLETASSRQRARAEREAEIAARLRHPNIVTVFESRKLADGRAAVVMEFVDGVALDQWRPEAGSEAQRLRGWLGVFIKVCDAVHHAHLNAVIHRDLKPANILVTGEARPVVLDFGIAKTEGLHTTRTGEFAGTPAYASPEQVAGHPNAVDALTDVYSLGVVLYHAVCGVMPYELEGSMFAMAQTIVATPPKPPREANHTVHPDLEAVVLRALRKDKAFRYQSSAALARDVERYLAGEPVEARAGSGWYVLRKAIAMNRRRLGWATLGLGVLAASGGAVVWSLARAADAADRAAFDREQMIAENVRARAVTELLREALPTPDPANPAIASAVGAGLSHLYFRLESGGFADEPALDQAVRRLWGSIYTGLGSGKTAQLVEYSEVSLRNGLVRLRLQHPGGDHPDIAGAMHELAGVLLVRERREEATAIAREALGMRERLGGKGSSGAAASRALLARCLHRLGRHDEAVREADAVLGTVRSLPDRESDLGAASMLELKARMAQGAGAPDQAEPLMREALIRRLRRLPCDDADLLAILGDAASIAASQPESSLAAEFADVWPQRGEPLAKAVRDDIAQLESVRALTLAVNASASNRFEALERMMRLQARMLGEHDPSIVGTLLAAVRVCAAENRYQSLALCAERAATMLGRRFGATDLSVLLCIEQAASAWALNGEPERAVELASRACAIWDAVPANARDELFAANSRRRLSSYQSMAGQHVHARATAQAAVDALQTLVGPESYLYASAEGMLALALVDMDQLADADRHSKHALDVMERANNPAPDQRQVVHFIRGHCLLLLARAAEARPHLETSWSTFLNRLPDHPWHRAILQDLLAASQALGDAPAAARWQALLDSPRATPAR